VGLSHERSYVAGAESFYSLEGNMCGTVMRVLTPCRGLRPYHVQRDRIGSWEVSCLAGEQDGERFGGAIRCRAGRRGAGGAKNGDQGKCGSAKHVPDAEVAGREVT
jgi:hypothetical protein